MGLTMLSNLLTAGLTTGAQIGTSVYENAENRKSVRDTNATNLQAVRETNAANVEQANLAYERSKPINQVADLMDAGLSRGAALQKVAGGGTYQAPVLQSATADAPQVDYSQLLSAFERINNIPANQMQFSLQNEQLKSLRDEAERRRQAHEVELRERNQRIEHAANEELRKQYGHDAIKMKDALLSKISELAERYNVSPDDLRTEQDLLSKLHLGKERLWKAAPTEARQAALDYVAANNQRYLATQEEQRRQRAADDSHNLALLREKIERINVKYYDKEKHEQLLNLMRSGEGLIQDNNIKFADLSAKNMENFVREAGINDERDARALAAYVNKLSQEDELNMSLAGAHSTKFTKEGRTILRLLLRDFGELLMRVKFGN